MSNSNAEAVLDDSESVRTSQQSVGNTATGTKKKSGFVITSVTDSGHGRPSSIVRDGEESADDLDESHTSYSDMSYSRTTDADHDQESTASEDTLNISAHESTVPPTADGIGIHNHITGVLHHPPQHHPSVPPTTDASEHGSSQEQQPLSSKITTKNVPGSSNSIHLTTLTKQHSETLDSPQELPHDNTIVDLMKEEKLRESSKQVAGFSPQSSSGDPPTKLQTSNTSGLEQIHDVQTCIPTSNIPFTSSVQPPTTYASTESTANDAPERPSSLTMMAVTTPVATPKTSASVTGNKVSGTRVYKVVKRDNHQPTKRSRGRWNWYDFSDNQTAIVGVAQSSSDSKISQEFAQLQHMAAYNQLIGSSAGSYTMQQSDGSSTLFKDQLFRTSFHPNGSFNSSSSISWEADMKQHYAAYDEELKRNTKKNEEKNFSTMTPDDIKSAMKKYAARTAGDASTGDMSSTSRSLKIDNKIEAAMDLVKKHLMSAVRDEVDELKEKIKDLQEENIRLKTESQVLRAALPSEMQSQLQAQLPSRQDASSKEKKLSIDSQTSISTNQSASSVESLHQQTTHQTTSVDYSQKVVNHVSTQVSAVTPHLQPVMHSNGKAKTSVTSATQNSISSPQARQEPSKMKTVPTTTNQVHNTSMQAMSNHHHPHAQVKMVNAVGQTQMPQTIPHHYSEFQKSDVIQPQQKEGNPALKNAQTVMKTTDSTFVNKNPS